MRKRIIGNMLAGLCLLPALLHGQSARHVRVQTGFSYDYGVRGPVIPGYAPLGNGRASQYSFEITGSIPLMPWLNLCPSYIFSMPGRQRIWRNLNGDFLPWGYAHDVPFDANGPFTLYSPEYPDLHSYADVWQQGGGACLTLEPAEGIELGTGLFRRTRRTEVMDEMFTDAYAYTGSTSNVTDHYAYSDTWSRPAYRSFTDRYWAVPVMLRLNYDAGHVSTGISCTRWLGYNGYWSFQYNMGVVF